MISPADLDLKNIENREWQLWSITLALLMVFGGITVAIFFLIVNQSYDGTGLTRSIAYRALGGLFLLITLFCSYVLHSRLRFGKLRLLLVDTSSLIASTIELNVLLSSLSSRIANASSHSLCQIALLTEMGLALKLKSAHTERKVDWRPHIGKTYLLGKIPTCQRVVDTLQPLLLREKDLQKLRSEPETLEVLCGGLNEIRTVLILPMVTKGKMVGIIILGEVKRFKPSAFTHSRMILTQALAKQVATAIDHARLIAEMQKSSASLLQAALDSTADGILVVDRAGKIVSFNEQFVRMWRIPEAVLGTRDDQGFLSYFLEQLEEPEQFIQKVKELYAQPEAQSHDELKLQDKRIFERFSQPQWLEGQVVGRVWSYRDITEQKRAEAELERQAIRDALTGLYNRRYFNTRMIEEIARANRNEQTLAILLCDLDSFKAINDSGGHQAGDEVLKNVSKEIQECTRGTDLVFRWGGDEIVVVLSNTSRQGVQIASERIRRGVRAIGDQIQVNLDLSIGVSLYPEHGRNVDELVRLADRALYIAKKGGDKIHIGEDEYQLDDHSVKAFFQPVVDIQRHEIIGYEALSRDPQEKMSILELFKRYQAIGMLSELKRVCFKSQIKVAEQLGLKKVFVNVDFNMLSQLSSFPKPSDIDVILEISEVEALHDVESHLNIVRRWRKWGYKFAIDDFGAGFISLPFIAQVTPDYIKMDRSTILHAVQSEKFRTFAKDMVLALRNYTMEGIIGEGIETEKELKVVKEMGIHIVQGYMFGKPQPLEG